MLTAVHQVILKLDVGHNEIGDIHEEPERKE